MVNYTIKKERLRKLVGIPEEQVEKLLPNIKCEIENESEDEIEVEITADRPDLLSVEGIARALKGIIKREVGAPKLTLLKPSTYIEVDESIKKIRPIVVGAVVRNILMDEEKISELMQVQEKLTLTYGRRRARIAIGIHDFDKLKPPFVYKAVKPKAVSFVPLGKDKKMNLKEILEKHEKGIEYGYVVKKKEKYPLFSDREGVISFPPIINSARTTVTAKTRNLFIEITGSEFEECNTALNILCHDFQDSGGEIESTEIRESGGTITTPKTEKKKWLIGEAEVNSLLGSEFDVNKIIELIKMQRIDADAEGNYIKCETPAYRADFIHPVDLIEEIAIAYGYNKFKEIAPSVFTRGKLSEITKMEDTTKDVMIGAGFVEVNLPIMDSKGKIEVENPVSSEYSKVRDKLIEQMIKMISKNTHTSYPQKIFEIGEIVRADEEEENMTRTEIRLAGVAAHSDANFSEIASVFDLVARALKMKYRLKEEFDKTFLENRCATVYINGEKAGKIGEISPEILKKYKIEMPISAFEIKLSEL